jgi:hypothetical protein
MPRPIPRPIPSLLPAPLPSGRVQLHTKDKFNWCWAACAQMLVEAKTATQVLQCSMASFLGPKCCQPLPNDPCNVPLADPKITALLTARLANVSFVQRALNAVDLEKEINAGRTVQVGWTYGKNAKGGGHVVLVTGCRQVASGQPKREFTVLDPDFTSPLTMTHAGLKGKAGERVWDATWILTL